MSTTNVTVLGASGGSGQAITAELAGRGHAVTAVDRRGDAPAPPYDAWAGDFDRMLDSVLAAVAAAGARLVHVDNLYMYGPADGPISERSPEHATGKGALRRRVAQRILTDDRLRATAGRYSDYYGPGATNSFVHSMFLEPAVAGRRMQILVDADQPHTFHYLPDAARGFAALVEHPETDGQAWILPAAPPLTQGQLADLVNRLVPQPVGVSRLGGGRLALASLVSSQAREGRKITHQFDRPWVIDASAFEAAFGPLPVTDHETALSETLTWVRGPDGRQSRQRKGKR